jgi:hypothetical protein
MVVSISRVASALRLAGLLVLLAWSAGCQSGPAVSSRQLIEHQAFIDFSGLLPDRPIPSVHTRIAAPRRWEQLPPLSNVLFSDEQWRSPSSHTGVGIVHAHLPLPISAKTVVWFAKQQYSKRAKDGKILSEWEDELGRSWFEAENDKYHIRGYVVVKGLGAWVVYFGYRTKYPPNLGEISLAARSAETAVPLLDETSAPATQPSDNSD